MLRYFSIFLLFVSAWCVPCSYICNEGACEYTSCDSAAHCPGGACYFMNCKYPTCKGNIYRHLLFEINIFHKLGGGCVFENSLGATCHGGG